MKLTELSRFKGVIVAAGMLVLLLVLFAFAIAKLQQNALQTELALSQVQSLDLIESNSGGSFSVFNAWREGLTPAQVETLNFADAKAWADLQSASQSSNTDGYSTAKQALIGALQALSEKRQKLVSIAPIAVGLLALLIFFLALIPQLLRINKQKEVQVESNQQAENILNTVSEGLFLLDKEGQIGVEQSASLKEMFRLKRDLDGSFLDFIGQYVPESSVVVAKDYLDLLYGDRVKEKLVKDLNPLNQVEINIARRDGSMESRFLDFKFARVMVEGKLQHLLGSITDVTREVMLERELDANKEAQEAQLDLLMNVLHIDQGSLSRFYQETESALDSINNVLQERGHSDHNIRSKLDSISEKAHRIKGDAAALKLNSFEFVVHEFETEVDQLKSAKGSVSGRDMLPAVGKLKEVFKELNDMQSIVSRFESVLAVEQERSNTDAEVSVQAPKPAGLTGELGQLVDSLAERSGVRVVLKAFGLEPEQVPDHLSKTIRDTSIQLIRNSVAHGALAPEQRLAAGKPDYLTITVSLTETSEGHTLIVRDDGEGLDKDKIVAKAFEKGLIKTDSPSDVSSSVLSRIIFHPGFSSKDEVDLDAGRGVGLSAVHTMIREVGGALGFSQAPKKYTQFSIRFKNEDK